MQQQQQHRRLPVVRRCRSPALEVAGAALWLPEPGACPPASGQTATLQRTCRPKPKPSNSMSPSSPTPTDALLARSILRAALRWARAADGVPLTLRPGDVCEAAPALVRGGKLVVDDLEDAAAVRRVALLAARANAGLEVRGAQSA